MEPETVCAANDTALEVSKMAEKTQDNGHVEEIETAIAKVQDRSWLQPPKQQGAGHPERRIPELGAWDLWKLSAPVPSLKETESAGVDEVPARPVPKAGGPAGASGGPAATVSLSSREASAMTDAAPTRCPTEDTANDALGSILLGLGDRSKEKRHLGGEEKAALSNLGNGEIVEGSAPNPPSLFALCELATELQTVLKGVQHVQRQILEAQKNIAWAIGEPSESLTESASQQQRESSFSQSAERAAAAASSLSQQQRELCVSSAPAAISGEDSAGSLLSLMGLLGKPTADAADLSASLSSDTTTTPQSSKLLKQLSLCDSAHWSMEGNSSLEGPANSLSTEGTSSTKRSPWSRSASVEQQQQEPEASGLPRQQSEGASLRGPPRKKAKGSGSNVVDPAPMPGVRFAKDRNSWVAFWCENGKQNYKSFSNKKFGPEMARLMAIAARQSFDDRINRNGAAYLGGPHRSTDSCDGTPAETLHGVSGESIQSLTALTSSPPTRTASAPCDSHQSCDEAEEQQLSRAEMQQLAASLGNPKGVCYAPSNNTWMAYGSMGSGARMCRSFPVSKFGFYGARRLAIEAVSQYQQKQQQQQQTQVTADSAAARSCATSDPHNGAATASPSQSLSPLSNSLDYTSGLQLAGGASDNASPDSGIRRRRTLPKEPALTQRNPSKPNSELSLRGLQTGDSSASPDNGASYQEDPRVSDAEASALLHCSKGTGQEGTFLGSDLSAASALLLPLVASGHLMKFSEEESLLRSANELACLGLTGTESLQ